MLIYWWKRLTVSHHLALFVAIGLVQVKHFLYPVTSQNHVIKESVNFISGSSSWYVPTLPNLVAIETVVVEICF